MVTRVALITGCGKKTGIGAATARALSAAGAIVVVSSVPAGGASDHGSPAATGNTPVRSPDRLVALTEEIVAAGGTASWVEGDVSAEADAASMVRDVVDRYGRLDILINNAGAPQGRDRADIEDVPLDAWEQIMAINTRGVFLMCRAAVKPMRQHAWGRIINISSSSAKVGARHQAVYAASKAALSGFTRCLALDLAPSGITVNSVCPFSILTDRAMNSARRMAGSSEASAVASALAEKAKNIPVGRHGRPEEVAAMVVYLASEASGYVTGQDISICGGTT